MPAEMNGSKLPMEIGPFSQSAIQPDWHADLTMPGSGAWVTEELPDAADTLLILDAEDRLNLRSFLLRCVRCRVERGVDTELLAAIRAVHRAGFIYPAWPTCSSKLARQNVH